MRPANGRRVDSPPTGSRSPCGAIRGTGGTLDAKHSRVSRAGFGGTDWPRVHSPGTLRHPVSPVPPLPWPCGYTARQLRSPSQRCPKEEWREPKFGIGDEDKPADKEEFASAAVEPEPESGAAARQPPSALWTALLLVVNRVVRRTQRSHLRHWQAMAVERGHEQLALAEADDGRKAHRVSKRALPSRAAAPSAAEMAVVSYAVAHWSRRSRVQVFSAWWRLTSESQARRAVYSFCDKYRMNVLATHSLVALHEFARKKAIASQDAAAAFERWMSNLFVDRLEMALEFWRRRASKGAVRRRCGAALCRFIRSSRLRHCVTVWLEYMWRNRDLAESLGRRRSADDTRIKRSTMGTWRQNCLVSKELRVMLYEKSRRLAARAWRAWITRVSCLRKSHRLTTQLRSRETTKLLRLWRHLNIAKIAYSTRVFRRSLDRWRREIALVKIGECISLKVFAKIMSMGFAAWLKVWHRVCRGVRVLQALQTVRAATHLHAWAVVHSVLQVRARRLAAEAAAAWRAGVDRRSRAREWFVAHQRDRSNPHTMRRRAVALTWWADWSHKRRRRRQVQEVVEGYAARRRGATVSPPRSVDEHERTLGSAAHDAVGDVSSCSADAASASAQHPCRAKDIQGHLENKAAVRALWRWNDWAQGQRSRRDASRRAGAALQHIVVALQWERAQDSCRHWASWASMRRARRRSRAMTSVEDSLLAGLGGVPASSSTTRRGHTNDSPRSATADMQASPYAANHMDLANSSMMSAPRVVRCGVTSAGPTPPRSPRIPQRGRGGSGSCGLGVDTTSWCVSPVSSASVVCSAVARRTSPIPCGDSFSEGASTTCQWPWNSQCAEQRVPEFGSGISAIPSGSIERRLRQAAQGHVHSTKRGRCGAQARWLRWTVSLWLTVTAAMPWLQWSFSLWRGAVLLAELRSLRWWSLALWCKSARQIQLRRVRRFFLRWAAAPRQAWRRAAIVKSERTTPQGSPLAPPPPRRRKAVTVSQFALAAKRQRQQDLLAEVAWQCLTHQLAAFVAWAGAVERSAALNNSVSSQRRGQPLGPLEAELVLCTFSAWAVRTCLRSHSRSGSRSGSTPAQRRQRPRQQHPQQQRSHSQHRLRCK